IGYGEPPLWHPDVRFVMAEPEPTEVGRNRGAAVGIVGDVGAIVEQLLEAAGKRRWARRSGWLAGLEALRRERDAERERLGASDEVPIHPARVAKEIREAFPRETVLCIDGGDFGHWVRMSLPALAPGRWLHHFPLGGLGAAVPSAIAARAVLPEAPVLAVAGDGAFGFTAMEFDTAVRHDLPFVCVVGNDAAWGIDRQFQIAYYGRPVGTDLRPVRYDRLVAELGGRGEHVADVGSLGPALDRALASDRIACVDVAIQRVRSPLADAMIARRQARQQGL
ncbi:MAG: thiamine pyrophosphate-binding protein, partial [Chloroflexi bacterium]|nr:thiamine pyrophosphate-binding protein [Chloroflexota bacterium]